MFSKLLKHEWKANAGLLGILSLCALGAGLLAALALRGIHYMEKLQGDAAAYGATGLSSALGFLILALVAYAFAVPFINLFRFYKSKFTDEGYLTFTLPVSAEQIFLSSFLNMLAWMVISALVLLAAIGMIVFIGAMPAVKEYMQQWGTTLDEIFANLKDEYSVLPGQNIYFVLSALGIVITPVYSLILLMTSITIGSVVAKKHKILATIGMYYCINFGVNIVESILTVVPTIFMAAAYEDHVYTYMSVATATSLLLQIGLGIGGYFLSTHLMKRKLNLP